MLYRKGINAPPVLTGKDKTLPSLAEPSWQKELNQLGGGAIKSGVWTPALTFATPGNLSVTYSTQNGRYQRVANIVTVTGNIVTSAFTHTTASGGLRISGLPYAQATQTGLNSQGSLSWGGITKAGYTHVVPVTDTGLSYVTFIASGSGVAPSAVAAADMPTTGSVVLRFTITYFVGN